MKKFVWDTSALINLKEPNAHGYSPASSLMKDIIDGWMPGPYFNIFPALAIFEVNATISKIERKGGRMLREFWLLDEHAFVYSIDHDLVSKTNDLVEREGFSLLKGADLVFACIAHLEDAYLVTKDGDFDKVKSHLRVIDLRLSLHEPAYREQLGMTLDSDEYVPDSPS